MTITADTYEALRARSGGMCELCGVTPATNAHHRRPRGMGGTTQEIHGVQWLLHLCGNGNTTGCHGGVERARDYSYESGWLIRSGEPRPAEEVPVRLALGWAYLTTTGGYLPATNPRPKPIGSRFD